MRQAHSHPSCFPCWERSSWQIVWLLPIIWGVLVNPFPILTLSSFSFLHDTYVFIVCRPPPLTPPRPTARQLPERRVASSYRARSSNELMKTICRAPCMLCGQYLAELITCARTRGRATLSPSPALFWLQLRAPDSGGSGWWTPGQQLHFLQGPLQASPLAWNWSTALPPDTLRT